MSATDEIDHPAVAAPPAPPPHRERRIGSVEVLAALLVLLVVFRGPLASLISGPRLQTWTTVFVSVLVQAVPFLVFGVVLSAVIAVFVPRSFWARALPKHPALAVPAAGLAGVVLPGCECGSVPIAGSLIRRGVTPAAALAFLLAAPAINPIVLTATAVAFPGNPEMVVARGPRASSWRSPWAGSGCGWARPIGSGCRTGRTSTAWAAARRSGRRRGTT
ncbi:hypothetical protein Asp14428_04730 [Actinoplanes sp. NBRC 14428]|nr:hypothetical protein Asp14428_04730 [Actinoplanes sp. NBRC 14428]